MAMRPPFPRLEPRRLRRLTAVGLAAALALTGETLTFVQTASADATYASRDAVTPVVSYNFDNDSGTTVLDASGHANNGAWSGTPAYAAGVSGKALHVSAGKNFVSLPKVAGQTDGSGSFSFEVWWYDNTETADAPLVANQNFASCGNSGFTFYHLSGTYQQRSCFAVNGTKTYSTTDTASIRNGWHDLAVVEDATAHTFSYYVDGVLFSTTSTISGTAAANFNSGSPIRIAQDGTGTYSATDDALVDDFNFYNQAITADQVAADFAATNPATHYPVTVTDDGHGTGTAVTLAPSAGDSDSLIATPSAGYTFAGWVPVTPSTLAIDGNGGFVDPGTPVTVEATFKPNTYTVAFNGNGATAGSMTGQSFTYSQSAALTANAFSRDGYAFLGWATTATGTPTYSNGQSVGNLTSADGATVTLYAVWDHYRASGDTVAPVATYDFDDQGSTVSDSSGWGDNAAWNGTATYAKGGLSGYAAHLSAGTTYIQLPMAAGVPTARAASRSRCGGANTARPSTRRS